MVGDEHMDRWMGSVRLTAGQRAFQDPSPSLGSVWHQSLLNHPLLLPPPPHAVPRVDTRWRCEDREGKERVPSHQEEDTADSQVSQKHEEPDSWREGVQKGEIARSASLEMETEARFTIHSQSKWHWPGQDMSTGLAQHSFVSSNSG